MSCLGCSCVRPAVQFNYFIPLSRFFWVGWYDRARVVLLGLRDRATAAGLALLGCRCVTLPLSVLARPGWRRGAATAMLPSHWVISKFDKKITKNPVHHSGFSLKIKLSKNRHFKGVLLNLLDFHINLQISNKFNKTPLKMTIFR